MTREEYLREALKVLDYFHKDYSKKTIHVNSGDYGMIFKTGGHFSEEFVGHSIHEIVRFVAEQMNKRIKYDDY